MILEPIVKESSSHHTAKENKINNLDIIKLSLLLCPYWASKRPSLGRSRNIILNVSAYRLTVFVP